MDLYALIAALKGRAYWIDRATLTHWLDATRPDDQRFLLGGRDLLIEAHAAVRETGWAELLEHPLFAELTPAQRSESESTKTGQVSTLMVAVSAATLLPFLHAMSSAAGERAYEATRKRLRALTGREEILNQLGAGFTYRIALHEDESGLSFVVPGDLPDAALEALTRTDLKQLAAPDPGGRSVVIAWDPPSRAWTRQVR